MPLQFFVFELTEVNVLSRSALFDFIENRKHPAMAGSDLPIYLQCILCLCLPCAIVTASTQQQTDEKDS